MEGLTLTRVVVLDDDEAEGLEVIKALWRRRIPALYFRGVEDAPAEAERLTGVRLLFLDMDLVPGATETKSKMSALVAALKRILSPENGPYSVVAWTKHLELVQAFEQYAFAQNDLPQPISVVAISKDDCKDSANEFDLEKVRGALGAKLAAFSPLMFLQSWEASCLDAAISATAELSKLAHGEYASPEEFRTGWKLHLLRVMNSMAKAVGGRAIKDDRDVAFGSFCSALSPLHADRLENGKPDLCVRMRPHSEQIVSSEASQGCDRATISRINTMLHCSYDRLGDFYAGNVYLATAQTPFGPLFTNLKEFMGVFVDGKPGSEDWKRGFDALRDHSIPVVLESNPTCDHSQNKVKVARLVAGMLVPRSEVEKQARPRGTQFTSATSTWEARMITLIQKTAQWWHSVMGATNPDARLPEYRFLKSADFLLEIGPLSLEIPSVGRGDYFLVLNAQYVFSLPKNTVTREVAQFRLRNQAFANFQFWFGNHASRPGMLMVQ